MTVPIDVEAFGADAGAWLAAHAGAAPPDYGAIVPVDLVEEGVAWQRLLFDAGWAGIDWPEDHGGRGLTAAHRAAWVRECALAGVPPFINMVGIVLAGGTILLSGTPEQQSDHLRPTLTGERVWCQLFSEPGAGSDLASLSTRAVADGDELVVDGQKVWCSGGRYSDWGILLARTDPDAPRHRGISFILLDMHLPGVEVRPLRQMTGGSEFDEVFLTAVRVPASCVVGPLHGGWAVAMATLTNERGSIGTASISLGRRLDRLLADLGGSALDPLARQSVTALLARGRALQYLGRRQGPVASTAASLLKLGITELSFDTAVARAALSGATAMDATDDAVASLLAAPGGRIAGGTSQIQRTIIGERLLGLPPEPRP